MLRALDLFCCAGGVTKGLQRAGFHVTGVDIKPQPNYCGDEFHQADALTFPTDGFDFIWASPPCQKYSWSAKRWKDIERVDLVDLTRHRLATVDVPTVIENVVGAPLRVDLVLTGPIFNLEVIRRRHFELNFYCLSPAPVRPMGSVKTGEYVTVAGHGGDNIKGRGSRAAKQRAMGIDWMSDEELNQAIPPAYSEFIGREAIRQISLLREAA